MFEAIAILWIWSLQFLDAREQMKSVSHLFVQTNEVQGVCG